MAKKNKTKKPKPTVPLRKTFIRSYTVRIIPEEDRTQKSKQLWDAHAGACRGAAIFGDLLLDIAGALPATLANDFTHVGNPDENRRILRGRRIALALNWFSVEDAESPFSQLERLSVAGKEGMPLQDAKKHLDLALKLKGVVASEHGDWHADVLDSLTGRIRTDAVWVNRAKRANARMVAIDDGHATQIIEKLFNKKSFTVNLPDPIANESESEDTEEVKADAIADPSKASRQLFSDLFGSSDPTKKKDRAENKSSIAKTLLGLIGPLDDKATLCKKILKWRSDLGHLPQTINEQPFPPEVKKNKVAGAYNSLLLGIELRSVGNRPNDPPPLSKQVKKLLDACNKLIQAKNEGRPLNPDWATGVNLEVAKAAGIDPNDKKSTEFLRLPLAFAARRFGQVRSWMRLMEIDREKARIKKTLADKSLDSLDPTSDARKWLTKYEQKRTDRLHIEGGTGSIVITKRMSGDEAAIFEKFSSLKSASEREAAINSAQEDLKRFDADLYKSIAKDGLSLGVNAAIVKAWVFRNSAMEDTQRLRIPCYSHPDPFSHPTFVEFGAEGSSKPRVHYVLHNGSPPTQCVTTNKDPNPREVYLQLPVANREGAEWVSFLWRSKRFWRDVGAGSTLESDIPRADRLGHNPPTGVSVAPPRPRAMFSGCNGWSGRLQAARGELAALKKQWNSDKKIWLDAGAAMKRLRWMLTISADLEQADGPHKQFERQTGLKIYNVIGDRGEAARAPFARVPGLRLLGVDLGHRTAAACTVWRTITSKELSATCDAASVSPPRRDDMFHHIPRKTGYGRQIFRRIGDNKLPDGKMHPAPWAELERQFVIRLDGERDAIPLSVQEVLLALEILKTTDCTSEYETKTIDGQSIASIKHPDVCAGLLRRARAFLRNHADIARVVAALSNPSASTVDQENSLLKWLTYSCDRDGRHTALGLAWPKFVGVSLPDGPDKDDVARSCAMAFWASSQRHDATNYLKKLWSEQEKHLLGQNGILRQLRNLVMPKRAGQRKRVGGLSLTRLTNIGQLRAVQKAFATRLHPDGSHGVIKEGFGDRALRQLEQLRMQRVKQLASRLIEAALGKGKENSRNNGISRKRSLVQDFPPCHAIVLENLKRYQPEYTRSRRENRGLLEWSSAKIFKCITEGCELYGIAKITVPAAYTSRYDFRTGQAGHRGMAMLPSVIRQTSWLQREFKKASQKKIRRQAGAIDEYLLGVQANSILDINPDDLMYLPIDGGQLFLPSFSPSGTLGPIDADLNASANIGLRAIADTDWSGAWWRILVETQTGLPVADPISGCKAIHSTTLLLTPKATEPETGSDSKPAKLRAKKARKGQRADDVEKTYVWRRPSCDSITTPWLPSKTFWSDVGKAVVEALSLDKKATRINN